MVNEKDFIGVCYSVMGLTSKQPVELYKTCRFSLQEQGSAAYLFEAES